MLMKKVLFRKGVSDIVVKFIVTAGNRVVFGNKHFDDDYHREVALRNRVPESDVLGGGLADLKQKRIFGTSYGYGSYDPEVVRRLLPGWEVSNPGEY